MYQFIITYNLYIGNTKVGSDIFRATTESPYLEDKIIEELRDSISIHDNMRDLNITRLDIPLQPPVTGNS